MNYICLQVSVDEMMDGLATKQLVDAKKMEKLLQQVSTNAKQYL